MSKDVSPLTLDQKQEMRAQFIYRDSIVFDGTQASEFTDEYFHVVQQAGITGTIVTVALRHNVHETLRLVWDWRAKIARNSGVATFGSSTAAIRRAKREGKVAYWFGFQNALPLEDDVDLLPVYRDLGVKVIQLTYNGRNALGCGCGEATDHGLTPLGARVIEGMNDLRMIVDLSHVGDRTAAQAIERAALPVFSHANARAICDNVRNKPDALLKGVAEKGGIIGVNAFPAFVRRTHTEAGERPTIADFLDHVDYLVDLAGIDHVGIALDLIENASEEEFALLATDPRVWGLPNPDGRYGYAVGIETVSDVPNVARGLVTRGYSDEEIRKVMGENWVRVLEWTDGRNV